MLHRRLLIYTDVHESAATLQIRVLGPLRGRGFEFVYANQTMRGAHVATALLNQEFDAVIVHRGIKRDYKIYPALLDAARRRGIPVIYDTDDLLIGVHHEHPDYATYQSRSLYALQAVVDADLVVTSTQPLADQLAAFHPRIVVIPNELPEDLWQEVFPGPSERSPNSGQYPITVGYIGTRTHAPDLRMVEDALLALLQRHRGHVRFVSVGVPLSARLRRHPGVLELVTTKRVARSYSDFVRFAASLSIDVGIAPLLDNPFNDCKSDVKFQEYSAFGIAGIYSDAPPYRAHLRHGDNGLLAANSEQWLNGLESLVTSHEIRQRIVASAVESLTARRHAGRAGEQWERTLEEANHQTGLGPRSAPHPLAHVIEELLQYQSQLEKQLKRSVGYQVGKAFSRLTRKLAA